MRRGLERFRGELEALSHSGVTLLGASGRLQSLLYRYSGQEDGVGHHGRVLGQSLSRRGSS